MQKHSFLDFLIWGNLFIHMAIQRDCDFQIQFPRINEKNVNIFEKNGGDNQTKQILDLLFIYYI